MNKDIRISTSFKGHRKRKKLKRLLGFGAEVYLIDLWLAIAMDCPDGILIGWTEEDIADACDWQDDPMKLVSGFIDSKWMEKNPDGVYIIHDWEEHQGWACKAKIRSESAKKAAEARWNRKNTAIKKALDSASNATALRPHKDSNADSNAPSPSPSPSPSLKKKKYTDKSKTFVVNYINFINQQYPTKLPKGKNLETNSLSVIEKLIRIDGFDEDYIFESIRWASKDDFWKDQVYSIAGLRKKNGQSGLTKFQNLSNAYDKDQPEQAKIKIPVFKVESDDR